MKILSVATFSHPDHFGGAERVISTVASGLARRGHELTLLTGDTDGRAEREKRDGVEVVRYPMKRGSPPTFYRSVWQGVRQALREGIGRDADVLHVHQVLSALAAVAPGGSSVAPRLFSFYAPYHLEYLARHRQGRDTGPAPWGTRAVSSALRGVDRYLLSRSDEVLVLSGFSRGQVSELLPAAEQKTTVCPAGVDLEWFHPAADDAARRAFRRDLSLPDSAEPCLLSVRRLVPRMGLPDLLAACARLAADGQRFQLALAGEGEQRGELETLAAQAGLADRVHFLGRVPDDRLPDLYRAADVFVLPTRSLEGFGMVTAEALASGLPVVATDAGATAELLDAVPGSLIVPAGAPEALANALTTLLSDAEARAAAGRAAREHATRHLAWDRHLDAVEHAAQRAVTRHRS